MATVHYEADCRDDFDDSDDGGRDPVAVADSGHSDAARAAAEYVAPANRQRPAPRHARKMHRISEVRQRQGVTLRNVARRLGIEMSLVRRQELPEFDLRLSELMQWQSVLERSRMVKLMTTAAAIRERTSGTPVGRMVEMLIEQILEIMPELTDVTPMEHRRPAAHARRRWPHRPLHAPRRRLPQAAAVGVTKSPHLPAASLRQQGRRRCFHAACRSILFVSAALLTMPTVSRTFSVRARSLFPTGQPPCFRFWAFSESLLSCFSSSPPRHGSFLASSTPRASMAAKKPSTPPRTTQAVIASQM